MIRPGSQHQRAAADADAELHSIDQVPHPGSIAVNVPPVVAWSSPLAAEHDNVRTWTGSY